MRKFRLVGTVLFAILVLAGLSGCATQGTAGPSSSVNQQEGIWVTGTGKVSAVPDVASLSLGIEAQETSVADAQAKAATAMNDVITALKNNGIEDKDIQTQHFSITQVTRYDPETERQIVIGYRVTNIVSVEIRDLAKTGTIIDATVKAGGDLTRINSIGFSIEDSSSYYDQAREKAMADASDKARQLADLSGVKLGNPTFISEGAVSPPAPVRATFEAAPALPTPISPGELDITLNIQVVYSILD